MKTNDLKLAFDTVPPSFHAAVETALKKARTKEEGVSRRKNTPFRLGPVLIGAALITTLTAAAVKGAASLRAEVTENGAVRIVAEGETTGKMVHPWPVLTYVPEGLVPMKHLYGLKFCLPDEPGKAVLSLLAERTDTDAYQRIREGIISETLRETELGGHPVILSQRNVGGEGSRFAFVFLEEYGVIVTIYAFEPLSDEELERTAAGVSAVDLPKEVYQAQYGSGDPDSQEKKEGDEPEASLPVDEDVWDRFMTEHLPYITESYIAEEKASVEVVLDPIQEPAV